MSFNSSTLVETWMDFEIHKEKEHYVVTNPLHLKYHNSDLELRPFRADSIQEARTDIEYYWELSHNKN